MAKKRQLEVPGAERPVNPELEELIAPYVEAMYERMELQRDEAEAKLLLMDKMEELGIERYVYQDGEQQYTVTCDKTSKIKVKRVSLEGAEAA